MTQIKSTTSQHGVKLLGNLQEQAVLESSLGKYCCNPDRYACIVLLMFSCDCDDRKGFYMKSNSGIYKIEKGQKMVGSCHLAQRDRSVFGVPGCKDVDEFDPSRFNAKVGDQSLHAQSF